MQKAKYKVQQIAAFYVNLANRQFIDEGVTEGITNLKLQKILYFAQAASLSLNQTPLFDDDFEAWKFGPVIPGIYHQYKEYGNAPIISSSGELSTDLDDETKMLLEGIWELFGKFSAAELVNITHNHSPWKEAFYSGKENTVIQKSVLENYYKRFFSAGTDEGHEK